MLVETIDAAGVPEGKYAEGLTALAAAHPEVSAGSYPHFSQAGVHNEIVLRSRDAAALARASAAVRELLARLRSDGATC